METKLSLRGRQYLLRDNFRTTNGMPLWIRTMEIADATANPDLAMVFDEETAKKMCKTIALPLGAPAMPAMLAMVSVDDVQPYRDAFMENFRNGLSPKIAQLFTGITREQFRSARMDVDRILDDIENIARDQSSRTGYDTNVCHNFLEYRKEAKKAEEMGGYVFSSYLDLNSKNFDAAMKEFVARGVNATFRKRGKISEFRVPVGDVDKLDFSSYSGTLCLMLPGESLIFQPGKSDLLSEYGDTSEWTPVNAASPEENQSPEGPSPSR